MNELLTAILPAAIAGVLAFGASMLTRPKIDAEALKATAEADAIQLSTVADENERLRSIVADRDRQASIDHNVIVELRARIQELTTAMVKKDNEILDLNDKVGKLERRIIYLEESRKGDT